MERRWLMLALVAVAMGVAAAVALAGGGQSIASAPALPIGQNVVGGGTEGCPSNGTKVCEFWRIPLGHADHLIFDYSSTNGNGVTLCLLAPTVTDYTISDAGCVANDYTDGKHEMNFSSPSAGNWTLEVWSQNCGNCGPIPLGYELTAYVKHYTHATLTGPRVVRAKHKVTLRGQIVGLPSGKVVIQSRSKTGWKTLRLMPVKANGKFVFTTRVGGTGTYRVRVVFYGDASHLPSNAVYSFKVV